MVGGCWSLVVGCWFLRRVVCVVSCVLCFLWLQIHRDTEPSSIVLGEQATMEKTTQRFQKVATTLADLNVGRERR